MAPDKPGKEQKKRLQAAKAFDEALVPANKKCKYWVVRLIVHIFYLSIKDFICKMTSIRLSAILPRHESILFAYT